VIGHGGTCRLTAAFGMLVSGAARSEQKAATDSRGSAQIEVNCFYYAESSKLLFLLPLILLFDCFYFSMIGPFIAVNESAEHHQILHRQESDREMLRVRQFHSV
jgi:hypothetical protein